MLFAHENLARHRAWMDRQVQAPKTWTIEHIHDGEQLTKTESFKFRTRVEAEHALVEYGFKPGPWKVSQVRGA